MVSPSVSSYYYDDYSLAADTAVLGSQAGDNIRPHNTSTPRSNSVEKEDVDYDSDEIIQEDYKPPPTRKKTLVVKTEQTPIHTYKHIKQSIKETKQKSPTAFHQALLSPSPSLKSLRVHLLSRPNACSIKDSKGRLPLHLLSLNKSLWETNDILELTSFIMEVYEEYTHAAVTSDEDGKIPFSYGVIDWVNGYFNDATFQDDDGSYTPVKKSDSSIFSRLFRNTERNDTLPTLDHVISKTSDSSPDTHSPKIADIDDIPQPETKAHANEQQVHQFLSQKQIQIPPFVTYNLEILNTIYKSILSEENYLDTNWTSTLFINALASIPNLTLVLLFTCSKLELVHRIMSSSYGAGYWVVYLLKDERGCKKAIEYMNYLQDDAIASLYIVPTILSSNYIHEILHTNIWKRILHNNLLELLQYIGIDLLFHLIFLVTFQMYANLFLKNELNDTSGTICEVICLISILYLMIRKCNQVISMRKYNWRNAFTKWDMLEWSTYSVGLGSIIAFDILNGENVDMEIVRKCLVGILALIYMNFIGWLKIVSYDMALLLRRLGKAMYDIRMYLLTFTTIILSFSHMFHLIDNQSCTQGDNLSLLCTNPYLSTYSTALGMFDISDYTNSLPTIILFILFTFIVLILLFAILIATVCNTINQDRLDTSIPFQTDRFIYYAHTTRLDILLKSKWNVVQYCCIILFLSTVGLLLCMTFEVKRQAMITFYGDLIVMVGIAILCFFMMASCIGFLCFGSFVDTRTKRTLKFLNTLVYPITFFLHYVVLGTYTENEPTSVEKESVKCIVSSLENHIIESIQKECQQSKTIKTILHELSTITDKLDTFSVEIKREKEAPTDEDEYVQESNRHTYYSSSASQSSSGNYNTVGVEV